MSETMEEKVAKLMRLAQNDGATEAEALRAMEAAQRLAMKHGLELASINIDEQHEDLRLDIRSEEVRLDQSGTWRRSLLNTIVKCNGGRCVWLPDGGKHKGRMHIFAPEGSIGVILQSYRMIENWIETESKFEAAVREETWVHGRTWRNSWIVGAVNRISERLREVHREQLREFRDAGQANALVKLGGDVDHAVSDIYPHLRTTQRSTSALHGGAFKQGQAAGNNANIGQTSIGGARRQLRG